MSSPSFFPIETLRVEALPRVYTGGKTHIAMPAPVSTPITKNSRTHHDARRPDDQQFGPPQADKTGSFFTETIIAPALAVASPNNTMRSVVIFMRFPPHDERRPEIAGSRLFGGTRQEDGSISTVCGA
jgi:hypothetical protein